MTRFYFVKNIQNKNIFSDPPPPPTLLPQAKVMTFSYKSFWDHLLTYYN